jgi:hypothetical protein
VKICTVTLQSASGSPYSQGKHITEPEKSGESKADRETRTWKGRLHTDADGYVYIPPMSFKNCVTEAAKFLQIPIPGKGKCNFTKHFEAGIMVTEPMPLGIKAADVQGETLFVPADGKRGSGTRVDRTFPKIESWSGKVTFYILDPVIDANTFERVLTGAGQFVGIGRFRPARNGYYGRFKPINFEWTNDEE